MKTSKKVTNTQMADIARLARVSKSTVSRALSDSPLVNQITKDRILGLAKKHNYRLNVAARNFRLKESLTIAVLLPAGDGSTWRLSDPFFLELLGTIAEEIVAHGHQVLLSRTSPQESVWIKEFVNKHIADGLILIGQGGQHSEINELAKTYTALSVWGAKLNTPQHYPLVGTDNVIGGLRATDYLISVGRRRIAFLGLQDTPEITQRYNGYKQALSENGLRFSSKLVIRDQKLTDSSVTELRHITTMRNGCDAIFASSDALAISIIRALQEQGIRVPEDIAVVGYDDISLSQYYNPSLTTIRQDIKQGGKLLVENLLAAMNGENPVVHTLNPELIIRESA